MRAVVDHGDAGRRDALADAVREGRRLLAIEVALEAVADRLVEQDAGPARVRAPRPWCRRGRAPPRGSRRASRTASSTWTFQAPASRIRDQLEASAAALVADLAAAVLLRDHLDVDADQGLDVRDHARRRLPAIITWRCWLTTLAMTWTMRGSRART